MRVKRHRAVTRAAVIAAVGPIAGLLVGNGTAAGNGLTLDVQLGSGQSTILSETTQTVAMDVFATVTGTDGSGANDGLQLMQASFKSAGGVFGNLVAGSTAPFNGAGSTDGTSTGDLDGDGDLDVGSVNDADATGFWAARADGPQSPNGYPSHVPPITATTAGSVSGASYRVKVGTLTFTLTGALTASSATNVNVQTRNAGTAALWFEEVLSPSKSPGSGGSYGATGAGVSISVRPEWGGDVSGNWNDPTKWGVPVIPSGVGVGAQLLGHIQQARTITLTTSGATVGTLKVANTNRYTIAGPGTLTLNNSASAATIDVTSGSHTIAAPVVAVANATITVNAASLSMSGGLTATSPASVITKQGAGLLEARNISARSLAINAGKVRILPDGSNSGVSYVDALSIANSPGVNLDLNDNDLVVQYGTNPSQFNNVLGQIINGFGGSDDSTIISTTGRAAGNTFHYTIDNQFVGVGDWPIGSGRTIEANSVISKYTYFGDVNLDGVVNDGDYGVVDANYNSSPQAEIAVISGDANLDGTVNDGDYGIIDANYLSGSGNPLTPAALSAVPEPTIMVLPAALLLAGGRRRRQRAKNA